MSITEKELKEYEDNHKKVLYKSIETLYSKVSMLTSKIEREAKILGIDVNLPNIGITFNNKINEISQEFKKNGISMFVKINEKNNTVNSNLVGNAIIVDLNTYIHKAADAIKDFENSTEGIVENGKDKELEKVGKFKKFLLNIRALFVKPKNEEVYTYKDGEQLMTCLSKYKEMNTKLWKYDYKENIENSVANYLISNLNIDYNAPDFFENEIEPTLKKLNLEDRIPKIKEKFPKMEDILRNLTSLQIDNENINKKEETEREDR